MRPHIYIRRYKPGSVPAGETALGDDVLPTTPYTNVTTGIVGSHRGQSVAGSPVARLSAFWAPSADEGANTLTLKAYQYVDSPIGRWILLGTKTIAQNTMVTFPVIVPTEGRPDSGSFNPVGGGGMNIAIVATDPGGVLVSTSHDIGAFFDLSYG